jgi:hypothetical protein
MLFEIGDLLLLFIDGCLDGLLASHSRIPVMLQRVVYFSYLVLDPFPKIVQFGFDASHLWVKRPILLR